jgi:DNA-cytosine methyltransferase
MRHIDLFSGIGGFALAASWVWGDEYENVGHSEVEPYACKVYHKHFSGSKCLGDITKIEWQEGQADLITGGFPCQPHSVAGKRKGAEDSRDLWGECVRAVRVVRPRFALFENVPGLFISNGGRFFNRVVSDLASIGYDAEWQVLSAEAVGAPHLRKRVWIVAYPKSIGLTRRTQFGESNREQGGVWINVRPRDGARFGASLNEVVKWPTPTTRDHKDGTSGNGRTDILGQAVGPTKENGSLNPAWVEYLMGYPLGWTDLRDSETPSYPK